MSDVRGQIRSYLTKVSTKPISDNDDIFALGHVDSLFAMQLVMFVEAEFAIVAEREDLDIRNFCSIAAIAAFVEGKLRLGTPPQTEHGHQAD